MSSSGQGHSTDNDNQMPTNSPDATGSSASAVAPSCSKYFEFALKNVLNHSTPGDAYKRCSDKQAEKGLHRWEQLTVPTALQDRYGEFFYCTESEELGATIVQRFSAWDHQRIPHTMSQSFLVASGSDDLFAYCKWESAPQSFFFESNNGDFMYTSDDGHEAEHLKLVTDSKSFTVDFKKRGRPEKPPQLVYDLKSRMEENMKREHEEKVDEQLRQLADIRNKSKSSHFTMCPVCCNVHNSQSSLKRRSMSRTPSLC